MLRIIQNSNSAVAKSYYSTCDYYTEGQELVGIWRGEAAKFPRSSVHTILLDRAYIGEIEYRVRSTNHISAPLI